MQDKYPILTNITPGRRRWLILSNLLTFYIPDCILSKHLAIRQAWREKAAFFTFFIILSISLIFIIGIFPRILCPEISEYTWHRIWNDDKILMVVQGKVYSVDDFQYIHPSPIDLFTQYAGTDITYLFSPPNPTDFIFQSYVYSSLTSLFQEFKSNDTNSYCQTHFCHPSLIMSNDTVANNNTKSKWTLPYASYLGDLTVTYSELEANPNPNWFVLYDKVYNISDYIVYGHPVYPSKWDMITKPKNMAYYLRSDINSTILNRLGDDATSLFEINFPASLRADIITFLNLFYYAGQIDPRASNKMCTFIDVFYLVIVCIISGVLLIKFITSLWILYKQYPKCVTDYVIISIPCYTEDENSLKKTIHAVYDAEYPDSEKLLFIVVDGIVTGKGNVKTTAEIVLNIFERTLDSTSYKYTYDSLGEEAGEAYVYSGWHKNNEHNLPYIIIIKTENRGKRDSQLILLHFLRQIHDYNIPLLPSDERKEMNKLQLVVYGQMINDLGLDPFQYRFVLSVDADTIIHSDAIIQMIYRMEDPNIIALCGETMVANKMDSWVSAIQVYEYYINHNLNKAFESLFSRVTCLPGCFSMYRIRSTCNRKKPFFIDNSIIESYSESNLDTMHKRNLLQLGEDRYFTTLIAARFPTKKLKFIVEAKCETVVPNTWSILLSQRRRWINSTIHNLYELLYLDRMCGICCFSMKFVIFLDILTTLCLPASCGYLFYLIYAFVSGIEHVPIIFIIVLGTLGSVQVLIFVIKRDFVFIFWFILYLIATPIWFIIIPIYSFAKMDDFSWGSTRRLEKIPIEVLLSIDEDVSVTVPLTSPLPIIVGDEKINNLDVEYVLEISSI